MRADVAEFSAEGMTLASLFKQIGRLSCRTLAIFPLTLVSEPNGRKVPFACETVDISEKGLRLRGQIWAAPGKMVELLPATRPTFAVRARVVWMKNPLCAGEVELGVEFEQPIPSESWIPFPAKAS